ncbi:MAG: choice-of-anchor L domain-containing protein [Deltaproteobacteria bacterium]|nr:choice-of-anchor L domain-containing protein [Deltaproteobacteria bacterium]
MVRDWKLRAARLGIGMVVAAVAFAAGCAAEGGKDGESCGAGTTACGTTCTVLAFDPSNCGACGNVCDSGVCIQGQCAAACPGGTTSCDGACVDTSSSPAHCGACGAACGAGEVCANGTCALSCEAGGGKVCSGVCVDAGNDPKNCGECGKACTAEELCSSGVCVTNCGLGLEKCGDACFDLKKDEANCGGCGTACGLGQDCVDGKCIICDPTTTDCDGDGWLQADGDCCDKTGFCGLEPELVNPGAIEVVGNGIDDNCNNLIDLFDKTDALPCDEGLASNSSAPVDYAKALGICRATTLMPSKLQDKTWGLLEAKLLHADGTPMVDTDAHSIRASFGSINPATLEGSRTVVLSSGIAADATQTMPGPNGGTPTGSNVSNKHDSFGSSADISGCSDPLCIKDWFTTANPPLKKANELPVAPNCGSGNSGMPSEANDSVMLYLKLRAPTNAKAFSFNSYFMSAEYPEFVCSNFNDQFVALVNTPGGTPQPIPNPPDKNLMTYSDGKSKFPIGINVAAGTPLFSVCQTEAENPTCWEQDVSKASCSLGAGQLVGTGFEATSSGCVIGGGSFWLTTAGNVIPGDIVELRIVIWDVGDSNFDSLAILDGFKWLTNATVPGTG